MAKPRKAPKKRITIRLYDDAVIERIAVEVEKERERVGGQPAASKIVENALREYFRRKTG